MPLLLSSLQFLSNSDGSGFYFKAIKVDLNLLFLLPKMQCINWKAQGIYHVVAFVFSKGEKRLEKIKEIAYHNPNPQVQDKCLKAQTQWPFLFENVQKSSKSSVFK